MWEFGRFEVYRVNPPLTRFIAALPVLIAGYEMDWSRFHDGPGARPEFALGSDFVKANGMRSIWLFTIARWACIPISLVGGVFCFLWGRELYGTAAGLVSLTLWCTDPNILAHAELITPDAAATAFGIGAGYAFWRWLKTPTWDRAGLAGLLLGLAQLSKMSWLFLFGLWPLLWLVWQASEGHLQPPEISKRREALQLTATLLLGLYILNLGYAFDGSFTALKEFSFVSETLAGEEQAGEGGNRFARTCLGELPVPLPEQYVLGFDSQKRDFEDYGQPSYLRGTWSDHGWWYYYLYGLLVKVPHGTQLLFVFAVVLTLLQMIRGAHGWGQSAEPFNRRLPWRDELVLLAPAVALFTFVSSQTEFSHHFRYVLPSLGLFLIFLGKPILGLIDGFRSAGQSHEARPF
ncbi:MAG: glycosyltransferase family 39 protein [Planctomycetota bacterium]|nr:glycosyltransferase family 39 protein [Planctomycetota bacterium]